MKFEKQVEALTNGNPVKPKNKKEFELFKYWYEQGKLDRSSYLMVQNQTLKRLLLLTHESVSDVQMNDLTTRQWKAFIDDFPEEGSND